MTKGKLLLIPNAFTDEQPIQSLMPYEYLKEKLKEVKQFAFESKKSGFRLIAKFKEPALKLLPFVELNEHTLPSEMKELQEALLRGETIGVVSDAGLPCLADPGSQLVLFCRLKKIPVEYVVGPSSIPLAVMLSGLSGQRFHFEGYLPKEDQERKNRLQELIKRSDKEKTTMVFIETPYRNKQLYDLLNEVLPKNCFLTWAADLTLETEEVITSRPKGVELSKEQMKDRPAIFLFGFV